MPVDPFTGRPMTAPSSPNEAELISGGLLHEIPPSPEDVIKGGSPSGDALSDLAGFNGVTPGSSDLSELYAPSMRKVLGMNIGYSAAPTGEPFYGFKTPSRWGTGQQWVSSYYDDPVTWNAVLLASGYYRGKEDPRLGLKADSYADAFGKLLTDAAASKKTITDLLGGTYQQYVNALNGGKINIDEMVAGRSARRGRAKAPLQVEVSNPEDLKEAARQAAVNTIGYTPDDGFLDDFVKLYQGMQSGYQKKQYAGVGKVTRPAEAGVVAQKELREDYKTQAESYGTVQAFGSFLRIIGAGQG